MAICAAAGIAALIGDCSPKEAMAHARKRFRCISVEDIDVQDFEISPIRLPSRQATQLFHLTHAPSNGVCDAFLSHSWHDSAEHKWSALQSWRDAFVQQHGREPRMWFDKACINQNDIEADLRGLPLFLSGCSELLVLCGPSYLSRLWCVMELFTFVHMGGDIDRIKVLRIVRDEHVLEDEKAIDACVKHFAAENCDCSQPDDKARMLSIILASYGDMASFNVAVRSLIYQVGFSNDAFQLTPSCTESGTESTDGS